MKANQIFYFMTLAFTTCFLISCEDFFDTTIEIDPPQHDKRISLVSRAFAGDTALVMNIKGSLAVLDAKEFPLVEDLSLAVLLNRLNCQITEEPTFSQISGQETIEYKAHFNSPLVPGDVIEIKASGNGYNDIYATDTVPNSPIIEDGTFILDGGRDEQGEEMMKVNFYYVPNESKAQYFNQSIIIEGEQCFSFSSNEKGELICLERRKQTSKSPCDLIDPRAINGTQGSLMKQEISDGRKLYTCQTRRVFDSNDSIVGATMQVINVSKAYYEYDHSVSNYFDNGENPFATPINVTSNIKNGFGVLELGNKKLFPLEIQ
ncbi:MAG: DUF4249 family protein [Saprospiraceae bacterium]|nr:DUF4249 family protein [Saprospiraceae bacterium]